ncbi:MAG: hypothetical protein QMB93_06145 [Schleiferiaceae bacterium]|jgi:hypothetical protein
MNLEDALNQHTIDKKWVYQGLIARARKDLDLLNAVIEKAFTGNDKERKRGCWILHHVSDAVPDVFKIHSRRMVAQLKIAETNAEERFVLRYFSKYYLPKDEEIEGFLLDYCFEKMMTPSKIQAPRIYSMSIAYRMVKRYPELAKELEQSILVIMEDCNAGLKSRGRRVQADLRALGLI